MKSDRLTLLLFLSILAIIFAFLFYIFGGDSNNRIDQAQNTYIEDDMLDEDYLDEELNDNRRHFRGTSISQNEGSNNSDTSSSDSDESDDESYSSNNSSSSGYRSSVQSASNAATSPRPRNFQTDVFNEYYRKPKTISPEQKAQKVRDRLRKKGFKNEEYIEMKALEATNYEAKAALKTALKYTNANNPEKAIELLEEQLNNLNPKDLKTRGKIQNALMMIYSNFGYPDKWKETVQHNMALRRKVIEIQKNTILGDDPRYQDVLAEQEKMIGSNMTKALDEEQGLNTFIDDMVKNGGTSAEFKSAAKGSLMNLSSQSQGQMSIHDVNTSYRNIEKSRAQHWANPK